MPISDKPLSRLIIVAAVAAIVVGLGAVLWHTSHCEKPTDDCLLCNAFGQLAPISAVVLISLVLKFNGNIRFSKYARADRFSILPLPPRAPPTLL